MALTPQVFQILLSLADRPRHGYAIIQDIRERTSDGIRLTASTLYDALARLADQALIEEVEVDQPSGEAGRDARRRYYQLTRRGRETAETEARHLERSTETARERRLLPRK